MHKADLRKNALVLRKDGKTYAAIGEELGVRIPKSTLSYWCSNVCFPKRVQEKLRAQNELHLIRARRLALDAKRHKREEYLLSVRKRVRHLPDVLRKSRDCTKLALAMLYLGEGGKYGAKVTFGNSDPETVRLFMHLFRASYLLDEKKFRCTLQCRADQDIHELEQFWSEVTDIPHSKFYKAQIDPRTIGRPSRKLNYKGVCRIDYFSADIFNELLMIVNLLTGR